MKLGFVTCVQIGLSCMEAIYRAGGTLDLVVTLRDEIATEKSGRVFVDEFTSKHEIPVVKIDHINDSNLLSKFHDLDWLFIVGWSQIAGPDVIRAPRLGVLGMHPTLLPVGRGRAAIPWAILKGLEKTGVTLFKLDDGIDTGPIIEQCEILLSPHITASDLYSLVNVAHDDLITKALPDLLDGRVRLQSQDESTATEWPPRRPEDGLIDMRGSANGAERLIRAVTRPYPGAFYHDSSGRHVIVWSAKLVDHRPDTKFIEFADGYLTLVDWEFESPQ